MPGLSHTAATALVTRLRHDVLTVPAVGTEGWAERLSELAGRDWLLVDKLARRSSWARPAIMSGTRGWEARDLAEDPILAVAASLHVDGRVRERATRALGRHGGAAASAAVALRLLDHVPEVARTALVAIARPESGLELGVIAAVLLNATDRHLAAERWSGLVDALGLDSLEMLAVLRLSQDRVARRWAVEQSLAAGLLGPGEVLGIAEGDPDQWLRRAAAEHLMSTPDPAQLAPLLAAGSVEARLTALTRVPEGLLDDSALERLLLDRAPRVREQARWRARRRGVDTAGVCRRHLGDLTPGTVAAALDGLAWVGSESDVPAVAELLQHRSPRVRAAAVRTYAARVTEPQAVDVLSSRLEDPSGRVSGAAAVVLARAGAPAEVAIHAWESPLPTARRAAWRISRAPGGWQRVAADLRAAADDDPRLSALGRGGLRGWLHEGAATTWGRPDPADAAAMTHRLTRSGLDDADLELVAFHAGLPFVRRVFTPSTDATPTRAGPPTPPRGRGRRRWFGRCGSGS